MSDDTTTTATPAADLASLERLIGTWTLSGEATGTVTYEWLEGGFFLLQHVDLHNDGRPIKGMEVIGHLQPFMEEPSTDIWSRFYGATGETFDYVYEVEGDTLTIWGGGRGSPAHFKGTFNADGSVCAGAWVYPGGGGYESTMTRVPG